MIRDIWTLFETEEEKEEREKKKHNERIVKHRIIRDIRTLFEQEKEGYYEHKRLRNFCNDNYIECESNWGEYRLEISTQVLIDQLKI